MSGYKKNAANNRDALFGGLGIGGGSNKAASSRPAGAAAAATTATSRPSSTGATGYKSKNVVNAVPKLSGPAAFAKRKEAEENKAKANTCMERGFFKKADPVAACTFYKRAADAYKAIGDIQLEKYMRISCGDTNMMCSAYATAANEYTRAAELAELLNNNDDNSNDNYYDEEKQQSNRRDASELHKKAAEAWKQMNESGKSASSMVAAAIALNKGGLAGQLLNKEALAGIEEAIEAFVPDPLNPYSRYRQTGHSAFIDENSTDETPDNCSAETMELAKQHIVTRAYSNEPVQNLINLLVQYGEYPTALYAAGAATTLLEYDGLSTLTLSRAYLVETIVTLALGDSITAEQQFLNRHVQKTFYLSSRECQLSEELFRAIKNRDIDALNEARSVTGPNKAALANITHDSIRQLVQELRISGVARKQQHQQPAGGDNNDNYNNRTTTAENAPSLNELLNMKTGYEQDVVAGETLNTGELENELDNLNLDGVNSDSDGDDGGIGGDELDALEDDDIDLR